MADPSVTVRSAGLLGGGQPAPHEVVVAAGAFGLDLASHRSVQLTAAAVDRADLLIAMGRRHVRELVSMDASRGPELFTLRELVRRGRAVGPRPRSMALAEWLAAVNDGRNPASLIEEHPGDDVADPIGGPPEAYRAMVAQVCSLVGELDRLLFLGPADSGRR